MAEGLSSLLHQADFDSRVEEYGLTAGRGFQSDSSSDLPDMATASLQQPRRTGNGGVPSRVQTHTEAAGVASKRNTAAGMHDRAKVGGNKNAAVSRWLKESDFTQACADEGAPEAVGASQVPALTLAAQQPSARPPSGMLARTGPGPDPGCPGPAPGEHGSAPRGAAQPLSSRRAATRASHAGSEAALAAGATAGVRGSGTGRVSPLPGLHSEASRPALAEDRVLLDVLSHASAGPASGPAAAGAAQAQAAAVRAATEPAGRSSHPGGGRQANPRKPPLNAPPMDVAVAPAAGGLMPPVPVALLSSPPCSSDWRQQEGLGGRTWWRSVTSRMRRNNRPPSDDGDASWFKAAVGAGAAARAASPSCRSEQSWWGAGAGGGGAGAPARSLPSFAASLHPGGAHGAAARRQRVAQLAARSRRQRLAEWLQGLHPLTVLDALLPIFNPDNAWRRSWDLVTMALVVYTAITVPLSVSYGMAHGPAMDALNWTITLMFAADIVVTFRTAYYNHQGELIRDSAAIARNYMKMWFWIDLFGTIPFDQIVLWTGLLKVTDESSGELAALGFLKAPRLLRLGRLLRFLDGFKNVKIFKIVQLFLAMILISHWLACVWYMMYRFGGKDNADPWSFVVDNEAHNNNTWPLMVTYYITNFYHSFLLLVGDNIEAYNNYERTFYVVTEVLGVFFYSAVVGQMATLVATMNVTINRHGQKSIMTQDTLRYMGAEEKTKDEVQTYFDYLQARSHPGAEGMAFLRELPVSLYRELQMFMYLSGVEKVPLFAHLERGFVRALATRVQFLSLQPGEPIFRAGDVGHEMYFIRKGHIAVTSVRSEMFAVLQPGEVFGEVAMFSTGKRTANCTALGFVDLAVLTDHDLKVVMADFPQSAALIRERAAGRVRELAATKKLWLEGDEDELCDHHAEGSEPGEDDRGDEEQQHRGQHSDGGGDPPDEGRPQQGGEGAGGAQSGLQRRSRRLPSDGSSPGLGSGSEDGGDDGGGAGGGGGAAAGGLGIRGAGAAEGKSSAAGSREARKRAQGKGAAMASGVTDGVLSLSSGDGGPGATAGAEANLENSSTPSNTPSSSSGGDDSAASAGGSGGESDGDGDGRGGGGAKRGAGGRLLAAEAASPAAPAAPARPVPSLNLAGRAAPVPPPLRQAAEGTERGASRGAPAPGAPEGDGPRPGTAGRVYWRSIDIARPTDVLQLTPREEEEAWRAAAGRMQSVTEHGTPAPPQQPLQPLEAPPRPISLPGNTRIAGGPSAASHARPALPPHLAAALGVGGGTGADGLGGDSSGSSRPGTPTSGMASQRTASRRHWRSMDVARPTDVLQLSPRVEQGRSVAPAPPAAPSKVGLSTVFTSSLYATGPSGPAAASPAAASTRAPVPPAAPPPGSAALPFRAHSRPGPIAEGLEPRHHTCAAVPAEAVLAALSRGMLTHGSRRAARTTRPGPVAEGALGPTQRPGHESSSTAHTDSSARRAVVPPVRGARPARATAAHQRLWSNPEYVPAEAMRGRQQPASQRHPAAVPTERGPSAPEEAHTHEAPAAAPAQRHPAHEDGAPHVTDLAASGGAAGTGSRHEANFGMGPSGARQTAAARRNSSLGMGPQAGAAGTGAAAAHHGNAVGVAAEAPRGPHARSAHRKASSSKDATLWYMEQLELLEPEGAGVAGDLGVDELAELLSYPPAVPPAPGAAAGGAGGSAQPPAHGAQGAATTYATRAARRTSAASYASAGSHRGGAPAQPVLRPSTVVEQQEASDDAEMDALFAECMRAGSSAAAAADGAAAAVAAPTTGVEGGVCVSPRGGRRIVPRLATGPAHSPRGVAATAASRAPPSGAPSTPSAPAAAEPLALPSPAVPQQRNPRAAAGRLTSDTGAAPAGRSCRTSSTGLATHGAASRTTTGTGYPAAGSRRASIDPLVTAQLAALEAAAAAGAAAARLSVHTYVPACDGGAAVQRLADGGVYVSEGVWELIMETLSSVQSVELAVVELADQVEAAEEDAARLAAANTHEGILDGPADLGGALSSFSRAAPHLPHGAAAGEGRRSMVLADAPGLGAHLRPSMSRAASVRHTPAGSASQVEAPVHVDGPVGQHMKPATSRAASMRRTPTSSASQVELPGLVDGPVGQSGAVAQHKASAAELTASFGAGSGSLSVSGAGGSATWASVRGIGAGGGEAGGRSAGRDAGAAVGRGSMDVQFSAWRDNGGGTAAAGAAAGGGGLRTAEARHSMQEARAGPASPLGPSGSGKHSKLAARFSIDVAGLQAGPGKAGAGMGGGSPSGPGARPGLGSGPGTGSLSPLGSGPALGLFGGGAASPGGMRKGAVPRASALKRGSLTRDSAEQGGAAAGGRGAGAEAVQGGVRAGVQA